MIPLIGPIISAVTQLGGSYLERKTAEAAGKTKVAVAQAEGDINWEVEQAKASAHSFKDEYLTIIFSVPLIMCFIPGLDEYALRGFQILEQTPDFYKYTLGVIVASSFAYRGAAKFMGKGK